MCPLAILAAPLLGAVADESYFPEGAFGEGREEFTSDRYSEHLEAMGEPSLWARSREDRDHRAYRLLWLPTFDRPVAVRITRTGGEITARAVQLYGMGGYEPGGIRTDRTIRLDERAWDDLLRLARQMGFWERPTRDDVDILGIGDGDSLILEGVEDGRYHVVEHMIPDDAYLEFCIFMLDVSGLDVWGVWDAYQGRNVGLGEPGNTFYSGSRFELSVEEDRLVESLESMVWDHAFSLEEMVAATGLPVVEVEEAISNHEIRDPELHGPVPRGEGDPLRVLPYPGGRHPRVGFREGALRPRKDTKASVFAPWDPGSYVVLDLPEALWRGDRLIFLAHAHIPTIWEERGLELSPRDWTARHDGSLANRWGLPDGVIIEAEAVPTPEAVVLELRLTNGTDEPLRDLRAQVCAMLGRADGFAGQTDEGTAFRPPYAARRSEDGGRWVVVAWEPCHRAWGNPPCPCLHADPGFPECPPGETVAARGVLAFVEADDADGAIGHVERLGWREADLRALRRAAGR